MIGSVDTSNMKPGDSVFISVPRRGDSAMIERKIARVTKTQLILTKAYVAEPERRFDRASGREIIAGKRDWERPKMVTEGDYRRHKEDKASRDEWARTRSNIREAANLPNKEVAQALREILAKIDSLTT